MNFLLKHICGIFFSALLVFSTNLIASVSNSAHEIYVLNKEIDQDTEKPYSYSNNLNENENECKVSINEIIKHFHHNHYNLLIIGQYSNSNHIILYHQSMDQLVDTSLPTPPPELV